MMCFVILLLMFAQAPDFDESFSFGLTHDWKVSDPDKALQGPSHWFVKDGILHQDSLIHGLEEEGNESFTGSQIFLTEPSWEDGTFLVRISSQNPGGLGLLFRVRDATHYYRLFILHGEDTSDTEVRFDRREGEQTTTLCSIRPKLPHPRGPWWILGITMKDDSFEAFLNDEPLLSARDDAFAKGGIGISCWQNQGLRVDSLLFSRHEVNRNLFKPKLSLLKGPLIGCVSSTGFEVSWETSILTPSLVEIIEGAETIPFEDTTGEALFHRVKVEGLQPEKSYQYKVISGPIVSPVYRIQLPPESFSQSSFCVYGNSHSNADAHRFVIRAMSRKTPDLIFHVGDLVAKEAHYEQWFPQFLDPADWLIHSTPFYLCPGDHERNTPWYDAISALPGNGHFYSYTFGHAFFVVLDSNQPLALGSDQWTWLERTLTSNEARNAGWRFCFVHEIPDTVAEGDETACTASEDAHAANSDTRKGRTHANTLAQLLDSAGFDILFTGQYVRYERRKLLSFQHVNTGGGGAPLDFCAAGESISENPRSQPPPISHRAVWHACKVKLEDGRLTFSAFTPDGKPFDKFELSK